MTEETDVSLLNLGLTLYLVAPNKDPWQIFMIPTCFKEDFFPSSQHSGPWLNWQGPFFKYLLL